MMSRAPSLSVVLPVFNGGELLRLAVDSVLAQSFVDFELLLLDDGSTDGAVDSILAIKDPRLKVDRALANRGLIATLNRGVECAAAPLIARMDADDVAEPERFSRQVTEFQRDPNLALLGTAATLIDEHGQAFATIEPPISTTEVRKGMFRKNPFVHSSVMVRTEVVRRLGGYSAAAPCAEDYELFLRIALMYPCRNLAEPMLRYRVHSAQESQRNLVVQRRTTNQVQAAIWRSGLRNGLTGGCLAPVERGRLGRLLGAEGTVGGDFRGWSGLYARMGQARASATSAFLGLKHAPLSPALWAMWLQASTWRVLRHHARPRF
jgi:cellulose synthase/poly-beta-1,6-N-acetylglucosamine synthase-like glycosyltransferase